MHGYLNAGIQTRGEVGHLARIAHLRGALRTLCFAASLLLAWAAPPAAQTSSVPAEPSAVIWANPIQGGPLDVLFVGPETGAADFTQLERRLQLKASRATFTFADAGPSNAKSQPAFSETALDKLDRALEKRYDAIVLARIGANGLPEKHRQRLLSLAAKGAGVVFVAYGPEGLDASDPILEGLERRDGAREIIRGIAAPLLTGWQEGLDSVHLYEGERRRAAVIEYWTNAPHSHCIVPSAEGDVINAPAMLDNYLSLVARAIRWAANRDPAAYIESIRSMVPAGPGAVDTPPQLPREFIQRMLDVTQPPLLHPYELRLDRPAPKKYRLRAQARYPHRDLRQSYDLDERFRRGGQSVQLNLPVGFGDLLLDVWLLDGDEVVDWYTEALNHEGWPEMTDVAFSSLAIEANDSIEISANVRPHYHRPRPSTVFVRATDSLGRIVAERSELVRKEGGPVTVELQLVDLIAPYLKVEVFAADTTAGSLSPWLVEHSDYAFRHVLVRRKAPSSFRFAADGPSAAEFNLRRQNRALARHGVDALHTSETVDPLGAPALDNLDVIPTVGPDSIRSWSTEPQLGSSLDYELREQAERYRIFGPGLYLLKIDPSPPVDVNALDHFQGLPGFLANIHRNIAALNRAWGTAFLSWEEAAATALRDPDTVSARMDLSSFADGMFLDLYRRASGTIRDVDERARVGVDTGFPAQETDALHAPMLMRRTDFMLLPPDTLTAEKFRSFRPDGATAMLRLRGAPPVPNENYTKWLPWFAAMHGLDGVWCDSRMGAAATRNAIDASRTDTSEHALGALAREVRVLQSGFADLLKRAHPMRSGIALYDSRTSGRMDRVLPVGSYTSRKSQERFAHLLDSFGYQYDFVDYEAVTKGELERYALCVLPFTRALSDEEALALQAYHRAGGALMADLLPGRYDEHGTRRERNRLEEVFGVQAREDLNLGPPTPLLLKQTPKRGQRRKDTPLVAVDLSVRETHAGALATAGDAPIAFVAGNAPGNAMLLNYRLDDPVQELDQTLEDWLKNTGATKRIPESLLEMGDFSGEVAAFGFSDADIYAFLRDPGENGSGERVRLTIGPDRHGYDALSGKHFGPGSKATLKMMPGEAALLCSLPYEVTRVLVAAPELVGRGWRLPISAEVKTRGALAGDHLVHVALTDPDGQPLYHYAQVLDCPDGRCETYIPLARNDTPGTYTVNVRDVLTGTVGEAKVLIR